MKKLVAMSSILILALTAAAVFAEEPDNESLTAHPPPRLKSFEERECVLGWLDDGGEVILPPGDTGYIAEFDDGTKVTVCRGVIPFGEEAEVQSIFGNPIVAVMATLEETCTVFPTACENPANSVARLDFGRTGFRCPVAAGELTTDWFQLTAPSGLSTFVCRFKR